jgi:hypothetical protein
MITLLIMPGLKCALKDKLIILAECLTIDIVIWIVVIKL